MEYKIQLAEDSPLGLAGQRVTLALQPQDVHDPTELPSYLAGYSPFEFRADEASPPILVDNDSDKFRTFDDDDAFKRVDVKGSIGGAVPEVDPKSALRTYKVVDRYVGSFIPKVTELATGNNYRPRMAASRRAQWAIELDRELDTWGLLGDLNSFDPSVRTAVGGGDEWNVLTGASDPIQDIQLAITKSAQSVSAIWFNQEVAFAFLRHPSVRDQMRQMLGDGAAPAAVATVAGAGANGVTGDFSIPGLPPFRVTASKVRNETTGNLDYILGNVAVLVKTPPGVPSDGETVATTYTFRRRGPSGTGFEVREFFIEGRGALGGTMVVVSQADEAVITGNNVGGIITNVIA